MTTEQSMSFTPYYYLFRNSIESQLLTANII